MIVSCIGRADTCMTAYICLHTDVVFPMYWCTCISVMPNENITFMYMYIDVRVWWSIPAKVVEQSMIEVSGWRQSLPNWSHAELHKNNTWTHTQKFAHGLHVCQILDCRVSAWRRTERRQISRRMYMYVWCTNAHNRKQHTTHVYMHVGFFCTGMGEASKSPATQTSSRRHWRHTIHRTSLE